MKVLIQFIVSIAVLAVGTVVGIYVEKHTSEEKGKIRYLDYKINESNLLKTPIIQGRTLEVLLDGNPINKLSQLEITVYNYSDIDYENVPLFLELVPKEGKNYSLVASDAVGSDFIPEAIETIDVKPSKIAGSHRVGYKIKTVNRSSDKESPEFFASFLITGDIPKINVSVDKKGLETRKFSYFSFRKKVSILDSILEWLTIIGIIVAIIVFYGLLMFFMSKFFKKSQKKEEAKFQEWLIEKLDSDEIQKELDEVAKDDGKKLASIYYKLNKEYRLVKTKSKILRTITGIEKPDHLKIEANQANSADAKNRAAD